MTRAVFYVRLSSSDDASTSIDRQTADLQDLAEREGWDVVQTLADDGFSGRKARANAQAALELLRSGEVDVLAVWKFDRWSRQGLGAVADLIEVLDARPSARFVALRDGLRSDAPAWRIIASVLAEVARMEAENTGTRVASSIRALRHSGRYHGGNRPYGYRSVPNPDGPGRVLEPDPEEAAVVRDVAARILGGQSLTSIVRGLNADEVPTAKSEVRRGAGESRGEWRISSLQAVWSSDTLLGRVVHKGSIITGDDGLPVTFWDPVLDRDTIARLRLRLSQAGGREPRARAARLLSGVVYCALCGRKCYAITSGGTPLYKCSAGPSGGNCPTPSIRVDWLDEYVTERFLGGRGDYPEVEEVDSISGADSAGELADIEAALREVTSALTEDDADADVLLARLAGLKARRAELRALPTTVTTTVRETGRTLREAWDATDDVDERRRTLTEALDHVLLAPQKARGKAAVAERITLNWVS